MEPLRDPNPSDVLEVRPAPCPFLGGLKSQKGPPPGLPQEAGSGPEGGRGVPGGALPSPPVVSPNRTSMTASFPSGMRSWSWMKNGEKGRNQGGAGPWQPWGNQDGRCREHFCRKRTPKSLSAARISPGEPEQGL